MIELIEFLTRVLSWVAVPFAFWGLVALTIEVIPRQFEEKKIIDDIIDVRRRLPVLTILFLILAVFATLNITANIVIGINGHGIVTNTMRAVVLFMIFVISLQWRLIYHERYRVIKIKNDDTASV